MLPFVRMLEYGNIKPKLEIKDVKMGIGSAYVLYTNGQLFFRGTNQAGEFGFGNTTRKTDKWYECTIPGVQEVYVGQSCTILKTTNKIYVAGWAVAFVPAQPTLNYLFFEDKTSLFSAFDFDNMKIVCSARGIFVINNNILYSMGQGLNANANRYGNGGIGSGNSTTFIQVGVNVKDVYSSVGSSSEVSYYITNDGKLFSTGRNLNGTCGLGYVGETPSFAQVTIGATPRMVTLSNGGGLITCTNGNAYMVGSRTSGRAGDGTVSTANYLTPTLNPVLDSNIVNAISDTQKTYFSDYMNTFQASDMYSAGADYNGAAGTGVASKEYYVYTPNTTVVDFSTFKLTSGVYYRIMWNSNKIYYTGQASIFDVGTPNFLVFTEINGPINV